MPLTTSVHTANALNLIIMTIKLLIVSKVLQTVYKSELKGVLGIREHINLSVKNVTYSKKVTNSTQRKSKYICVCVCIYKHI